MSTTGLFFSHLAIFMVGAGMMFVLLASGGDDV